MRRSKCNRVKSAYESFFHMPRATHVLFRPLDIPPLFLHIPARLLTKLKAAGSGPGKRLAAEIDAAAAGA